MPTLLLIRHARSTANAAGILAGWSDGVALDASGRAQAVALGARLAGVRLARVVSSPLQRCRETADLVLRAAAEAEAAPESATEARPEVTLDARLGEVRYGDWTGRRLAELANEPLWQVVQTHPSAARFPGEDAESIADVQHRAVQAVRAHDREVALESGEDAVWAAFSHGDVIAAVLADALGMHLDAYQRIQVFPSSVSVVRFTTLRPFVVRMNDSGDELAALTAVKRHAAVADASHVTPGGDA